MFYPESIPSILQVFDQHNTNIGDVILMLLNNDEHQHTYSTAISSIRRNIEKIMDTLVFQGGETEQVISRWSYLNTIGHLQKEMCIITSKEAGFHFSARKATETQLQDFDIQEMSTRLVQLAPRLCNTIDVLLEANPTMNYKRNWARQKAAAVGSSRQQRDQAASKDGDITMEDISTVPDADEGGHWDLFNVDEMPLIDDEEDEPEGLEEIFIDQLSRLKIIKRVVSISIMMQSTNRSCNALQSEIGIFLHSCGSPETVRELLARMGLSISTTSINEAISSLSKEVSVETRKLAKSLLATYAYDNLDIDLKHSTPTVENSAETLIHITSGTLFPLYHGVTLEDLNVSDTLWNNSKFNPDPQQNNIPKPSLDDIFQIHPEAIHSSGYNRRERFNAWKFLSDLIHNGPEYFRRFRKDLGDPEVIEGIPVIKTKQIPLRCVDVSPSTPAQNAEALDAFFQQGGIGDPNDDAFVHAVNNTALPIAGDLLTCQHARSLQESRAEEKTSWRRVQGVVFIMGLFHLKMACADAIWRIFIHPKAARTDTNSLIAHVSEIRPKETGKIETKPGFRRMHEVIQHTGIAARLDIWRIAASERAQSIRTLEDFAKAKPNWEDLTSMAHQIARKYVAGSAVQELRELPEEKRDKQYENMLLRMEYFLLYEEISYAMNAGDIGRVEVCFIPWMMIFAACGKHKYAAEMQRYIENMHFLYPKSLSRAIRMNILCNPTGKPGAFRALDWVVEHNNLYIKRIYGGKYSNHQKARILAESPLIEIYKNIRLQFERMFCLDHKTTRHSPPKMNITFKKLGMYMEKEKAHVSIEGRDSTYSIPDMMEKGINVIVVREGRDQTDSVDPDTNNDAEGDGLGDEMEEVEDDGGLDL